jgi:hypothetical protein
MRYEQLRPIIGKANIYLRQSAEPLDNKKMCEIS